MLKSEVVADPPPIVASPPAVVVPSVVSTAAPVAAADSASATVPSVTAVTAAPTVKLNDWEWKFPTHGETTGEYLKYISKTFDKDQNGVADEPGVVYARTTAALIALNPQYKDDLEKGALPKTGAIIVATAKR